MYNTEAIHVVSAAGLCVTAYQKQINDREQGRKKMREKQGWKRIETEDNNECLAVER